MVRRVDGAIRFFRDLLGLTLIKKTVNLDDPYTPLLIFGDQRGTPGTQIHCFVYPKSARAVVGVGTVASFSLGVPPGSLDYWERRLKKSRRRSNGVRLEGYDGLSLVLSETDEDCGWNYDPRSDVPKTCAIRGLHSTEVVVDPVGHKFWMSQNCSGVRLSSGEEKGALGYGGVHHLAFVGSGRAVFDRYDYRSSYFYDPGGLLCEIVEGPGLVLDKPVVKLSDGWCLPPVFERRGIEIENVLRSMK